MILSTFGLVVLLTTAGAAACRLVVVLGAGDGDRLSRLIAWGTLVVAWVLICAQMPAFLAECFDWPIVRMPIISGVSALATLAVSRRARRSDLPSVPARMDVVAAAGCWWSGIGPAMRWGCVFPVLLLHGGLIALALTRPPLSDDGLFYHIPLQVQWLQTHRLSLVPGVWNRCMPANCELWQMPFTSLRIEPLIELSLVPIGGLLALIVAGLARQLGAGLKGATVAAMLVLTCPMVAMQMYSAYVDMFGAAFVLGGLYWLMNAARSFDDRNRFISSLAMSGLSVGVALGSKIGMLGWGGLIVFLVLALSLYRLCAAENGRHTAARDTGRAVAVFVLGMLATSAFWYGRNTIRTGWPLYPVQVQVAGRTIGSLQPMATMGAFPDHRGWSSLAYQWFEWNGWNASQRRYAEDHGIGPALAVFGAPAVLLLLMVWAGHRRRGRAARRAMMLVFILGGIVLYVVAFRSYARFALPVFLAMLSASGVLVGLLWRIRPRATAAMVASVLIGSAAMTGFWPAREGLSRVVDGRWSRSEVYGIPDLFDELQPGTTVLNLGSGSMNYPLMGSNWGNRVIDTLTLVLPDSPPGLTRQQLDVHGVDVVYVRGNRPPPFAPGVVYEVLHDDSNDQNRLATTTVTRVYRVVRERQVGR